MIEVKEREGSQTERTYLHIFGSSINSAYKVKLVREKLYRLDEVRDLNVDLEDWENVLRIECRSPIDPEKLKNEIVGLGFSCYELSEN